MAHAEAVTVSIEPTLDREIDEALAASVNLPTLLAAGPMRDASWSTAVATERTRLTAVLRSFGYLEARIDVAEVAMPRSITFRPVPGQRYRIAFVKVTGISGAGAAIDEGVIHGVVSSVVGEPLRGDLLSGISSTLVRYLRRQSYFHAEVANEVEADPATATASVHLAVTLGAKVRFGRVTFHGARATDPQVLSRLQPFPVGSAYTPDAVEELRAAVEGLPLVRSSRIDIEGRSDPNGLVPVRVTIVERADPARLGHLKLTGSLALIAALAALSMRQWVQTAQLRPRVHVVQSLDLAILVLLIAGLALVLARAAGFLM